MILLACLYSSGGLDGALGGEGGPTAARRPEADSLPPAVLTAGGGLAATSIVSEIQSSVDGAVVEVMENVPVDVAGVIDEIKDVM